MAILASGRPIIFAGSPPNDPISDSNSWISVKAGDIEGVIHALNSFQCMSNDELIRRGKLARHYANQELSMSILGPRMEKILTNLLQR